MSKIKTFAVIILCLLTSYTQAQSIEVNASLDKNPVMEDESFNLTVVANADLANGAFDPSPLLKDFVVGRTSVSSQTKIINFTTSKSITWTTVLIPKSKGRFTIPAFDIGGSKTQPIEVLVVPLSSASSQARDLFITTAIDLDKVYLQQQIHYTVKLHLAKDLQRGSLSSPTLENADIRQIGEDKEYNEIVNGKRYRIIERSFAIVPQQSGTFTIASPLFEGEVTDNNQQSFGFFNRSKSVNRRGPSQTIQVLPVPSNYQEHWLPSEFVQLDEEWQGNTQEYEAGEPITRTITLTAVGVIEEQLPAVGSQYPDSVKTYPDQAETATIEKDKTLIAQRKESIAIIPTKAGPLTIPEVKLAWFNTITQKTEYAVLPEKTLTILPASQANSSRPLPQVEQTPAPPPVISQPAIQGDAIAPIWQWLSLGLAGLWLITLSAWWWHFKHYKRPVSQLAPQVRRTESEQALWKILENALNKGQASDIHQALRAWLSHLTDKPDATLEQSLQQLASNDLNAQVSLVMASRYSQQTGSANTQRLHQILRKIRKVQRANHKKSNDLAPLYSNT